MVNGVWNNEGGVKLFSVSQDNKDYVTIKFLYLPCVTLLMGRIGKEPVGKEPKSIGSFYYITSFINKPTKLILILNLNNKINFVPCEMYAHNTMYVCVYISIYTYSCRHESRG